MSTMPYITIIQKLTTDWGKQSRGAPGAIQRNATPEAVDIPLEQNKKGRYSLLEQSLMFYESANFDDPSPDIRVDSLEPMETIKYRCIFVQNLGGGLRVSWQYTPEGAGMPLRPPKKNDFIDLSLNQWGRIIYNGRFSMWEGGWWYSKTVFNIGIFENPRASVFVETEPDKVLDKRAKLY